MKKSYFPTVIISILFVALLTIKSHAQSFNQIDDEPHDISYCRESKASPPLAKVLYGRPQKNGEQVFGNLVPYDKIWRTGANEATEIKFYKDVKFGDVSVAAGTYVLLTIPGEKEWEIILNSKLDVLGAFQYNPIYDVAKIKIPVSTAETLESFSIAFKDSNDIVQMVLGWDSTRIKIPLHFKKESAIVKI